MLCEKVKEQKRLYTELHSSVQNELDADVVRATLDRLEMRKLELEKAELRQKQFVLVAQQKPRELRQMLDDGAGFNDVFAAIDVKGKLVTTQRSRKQWVKAMSNAPLDWRVLKTNFRQS